MEEKQEQDDLYITKTNLLSCEDVVSYLWNKCNHTSSPFKPEKAVKLIDKVVFSDKSDGETLKKTYQISTGDLRHMAIKNHQEYDVDTMTFETFDKDGKSLSKANLIVIYRPIEKFYYVLWQKSEKELQLLVRCMQKKRPFSSFPTETISYF